MKEQLFSDRQVIYKVGDPAETIFSVVSGFVILRRPTPGGASREQLVGPGAVFGAAEVLAGTFRSATAQAHGETVVAAHLPEAVMNEMMDRPEAADAMVSALFSGFTRARAPEHEEVPTIGPYSVRLIPLDETLIDQMGDTPLTIDRFPFFIGRSSVKTDADIDGPMSGPDALVLQDRRPFRLSRRHFSINREDHGYIVSDHRSFHGTIVNGIALGAGGDLKIALEPGENEIIAGGAESPFRFTCIVPTTPAK